MEHSVTKDSEGNVNVIVEVNFHDWDVHFDKCFLKSIQPKPQTNTKTTFSPEFYYKLPIANRFLMRIATGIGPQFQFPEFVKKIIIPKEYREIRDRAFIGKGIEEIVFEGDSLEKSSLTKIGQYAFANCLSLKKVTFCETFRYVDIHAGIFQNCERLKFIDLRKLLVKTIPADCFHSSGLEDVIFSDDIMGIGKHAFDMCKLSEVVLPANLENVGDRAFHMNKLKKVTFPNTMKVIGEEAFAYNQIETLDLSGPNMYKVDTKAFYDNNLTEMNLSYFISVIGCKACEHNPSLAFSESDYPFLLKK